MALASIPKLTLEIVGKGRDPVRLSLHQAKSIIGRESGDIVLHDAEASALHAELDCSQGHVIVRDLGSSNGTWRDGTRLPQFALYEGQSFICGATEIRLVALEGVEDRPKAGQTAVGKKEDILAAADAPEGSSATMQRGSGIGAPPSTRTLLGSPSAAGEPTDPQPPPPGWSPPSSAGTPPTAPPGGENVPALGSPAPLARPTEMVEAPAGTPALDAAPPAVPASSTATVPGSSASPSSTATVPGPTADAPPPSGQTVVAPVEPAVSGGTAPVEAAPHPPVAESAATPFRAPVANAVIRGADAPVAPAAKKASSDAAQGRGIGRVLGMLALGLVVIGALGGLGYWAYTMLAGRTIAFTQQLAEELPQDAIGFVGLASVEDAVALFGDDVPDDVRQQATERAGFDPFDLEAWEELGVDPSAPVGIGLLSVERPMVSISVGVADKERLEAALKTVLPGVLGRDELLFVARGFGDLPGLWLEEPVPTAVVFREDRALLITSYDGPIGPEDVERAATTFAELTPGVTLRDRPGFAAIVPPKGAVLAAGYVDGASLRAAIPGAGMAMMASRMALADIDGFMGALSHDGSDIHLTYETVVREGSRHLELLDGGTRKLEAIDRIPGPILAEADVAFDADAFDRSVGGLASFLGASLTFMESELREAYGIDVRADLTQNLSGSAGYALQRLPSERGTLDFAMVGWLGVKDEAAAKSAAERVYAKAHDELGMQLEQVDGVTVYKIAEPAEQEFRDPTFVAWVHEGHVWFGYGEVDVAPLISGPTTPFRKDARNDAVRDAIKKGSHAAGFVDIREAITALRPILSEGDREELDDLDPVLSLLEVASIRGDRKGRTIVMRGTLHTGADEGLPALVQATTTLLGGKVAGELALAARRKRCQLLTEHVTALTRAARNSDEKQSNDWETERRVLEDCEGPKMTEAHLDCYLAATELEALVACDSLPVAGDGGDEAGDDDGGDEAGDDGGGEPRPVPYVDDIWPHLSDDPDSDRPQPEVNYAVPLGPQPQARGSEHPLVTIVQFGDFQCQYCKRVAPTLDEVLADHGKDVQLVFRHLPLDKIHKDARNAAKAAIAAGKQGKFWEMHGKLYAGQSALTEANFVTWATDIGLDVAQYERDYYDAETDRRLQRDIEAAAKFGAKGTPAFFVNGRYVGGAESKQQFDALIKEEKARAEKFVERRGNTRKRLYEDMISHFAPEVIKPRTAIKVVDPDAKRYLWSTSGLPQKGASGFARVNIVECGDFDCPYCARVRTVIDKVLAAYPTQVAFFFAHDPLEFHHGAEPAARAAVAANNQGKFWEMHDELFKGQSASARTEADFVGYARAVGLDLPRFKKDFAAAETAKTVEDQRKLCVDSDAAATPTFFINGARIEGAQDFDRFKALIDSELASGI